ncbi:hypothetical protein JCM39194_09210 [Desulfotomaculum varum]
MPRHVVRSGDTIKNLAKKYNVSFSNLTLANSHLKNLEQLNPGDVIYIPDAADGTYSLVKSLPLKMQLLSMIGFSPRQIQEHYKIYTCYVNKINEIRLQLRSLEQSESSAIFSQLRTLKDAENYTVSSCKLHELYFENLGGKGGPAAGAVLEAIVRDFGSYEYWEKDFRATGLASRGWAIMGYDYDDGHLHNYGLDYQGMLLRIEPLLVLDVHEHAYFLDYGTNCASYIDAFCRNLDWSAVNNRLANLKFPI